MKRCVCVWHGIVLLRLGTSARVLDWIGSGPCSPWHLRGDEGYTSTQLECITYTEFWLWPSFWKLWTPGYSHLLKSPEKLKMTKEARLLLPLQDMSVTIVLLRSVHQVKGEDKLLKLPNYATCFDKASMQSWAETTTTFRSPLVLVTMSLSTMYLYTRNFNVYGITKCTNRIQDEIRD